LRKSAGRRSLWEPQALQAGDFVLFPAGTLPLPSPLVTGTHKNARAPGSAVSKQPPNTPNATGLTLPARLIPP
jgi:hypothetical protein